jgi:hypothetical protein
MFGHHLWTKKVLVIVCGQKHVWSSFMDNKILVIICGHKGMSHHRGDESP